MKRFRVPLSAGHPSRWSAHNEGTERQILSVLGRGSEGSRWWKAASLVLLQGRNGHNPHGKAGPGAGEQPGHAALGAHASGDSCPWVSQLALGVTVVLGYHSSPWMSQLLLDVTAPLGMSQLP